jgi:hypothetical protein
MVVTTFVSTPVMVVATPISTPLTVCQIFISTLPAGCTGLYRSVQRIGLMGKSGYLPDISGRFNQWTGYAVKQLQVKNYEGAIGALDNMNSLLDEEHRITVDTDEYFRKLASEKFYLCNFCTESRQHIENPEEDPEDHIITKIKIPTEVNYSEIKVFDRTCDYMESVMTSQRTRKAWICPKCKSTNMMKDTKVIQAEHDEPFYIGIVPEPPMRTSTNRIGFDRRFRRYFNIYSKELEHALMNYRVDYIKDHGEDMADRQFVDKGD